MIHSSVNKAALMKNLQKTDSQAVMMARYNMYAFGLPFILVTAVLAVEIDAKGASPTCFAHSIRPGFGEESCWFALCSSGQVLEPYFTTPHKLE